MIKPKYIILTYYNNVVHTIDYYHYNLNLLNEESMNYY